MSKLALASGTIEALGPSRVRLLARRTYHAGLAVSRHVRVADNRARLAHSTILQGLSTSLASDTSNAIRTILIVACEKTLVAIALIVLRLRSRSTSQTLTPVAVLASGTIDAYTVARIRLLPYRARDTHLAA